MVNLILYSLGSGGSTQGATIREMRSELTNFSPNKSTVQLFEFKGTRIGQGRSEPVISFKYFIGKRG